MRSLKYILIPAVLLQACDKKSNCGPRNIVATEMVGHWYDTRERTAEMFAGTRYEVVFGADSFKMALTQWTDMLDTNLCSPEYKEYVKGYYVFDENVVELHGVYTDSLYEVKTGGCYKTGNFVHSYKTQKKCDVLTLNEKGNIAPNMIIELSQK